MRNFKRVLSLVLALMMALSLMAFSSSASAAESTSIPVASEKYPDDYNNVTDVYKEAVDVVTALEVIEGNEDGTLKPDQTLNRAEAAMILARLMLGVEVANNMKDTNLDIIGDFYYDVGNQPDYAWAAGVIISCTNMGIIAGDGWGAFEPQNGLTGTAFGKMLLCALGYNAEKEGFIGKDWELNVKMALTNAGIELRDGNGNLVDLSKNLTREEAMEMTCQALQAALVEYPTNINNGAAIATRNGATYVTSALAREQRINNRALTGGAGFTVEFAEKYFPSLWLTGATTSSGALTDRTDAFGRPAHTWTYKNVDINTFDDEELLVDKWTTGVSGATLSKAINYSAISKYGLEVYVDGATVTDLTQFRNALANNSSGNLPYTGPGVQVEVYIDHEPIYGSYPNQTGNISIVIINTYLAEVTSNGKVNVYYGVQPVDGDRNLDTTKDTSVSDYTKGDKVKVLVADPDHGDYTDGNISNSRYKVQDVTDVETVSDVKISSYSLNNVNDVADLNLREALLKNVIADGTTYNASQKLYYDADVLYNYNQERTELLNATFNIYKDDYGFALGVEEVEAPDNYIFVAGWAHDESALGYDGDRALIITTDGDMKVVSASAKKLQAWTGSAWVNDTRLTTGTAGKPAVNTWYTYSMSGDTYVLEREVKNQGQTTGNTTINNKYTSLTNADTFGSKYAYGNNDSVYIVVKADKTANTFGSIVEIDRVITGIRNVDITASALTDDGAGTNLTNSTFFTSKVQKPSGESPENRDGHSVVTSANTFYIYDDNNYVLYAVVIGTVNPSTDNMVYFTGGATARHDIDGKAYVTYNVIMNGQKTTVDVLQDAANGIHGGAGPQDGELYQAGFDTNGRILSLGSPLSASISNQTDDTTKVLNATNKYVLQGPKTGADLIIREDKDTLYVQNGVVATSNPTLEGYVRLANDCKIFLDGQRGYEEKSLAEVLESTNGGNLKNGQVVAICNDNGEATTLIITTTSKDVTPTVPLTYTVTPGTRVQVKNPTSGSWTSSPVSSIKAGDTVYVRVTDSSYVINAASIGGATLEDKGNGEYSFVMPAKDLTVTAKADESQTMTITIKAILQSDHGNLSDVSTITVTKAEVGNGYVVSAPKYEGFIRVGKEETVPFNPNGATVNYTYKQLGENDALGGEDDGHPTEAGYDAAYNAAKINVVETTTGNKTIFTFTGDGDDIVSYLTGKSNHSDSVMISGDAAHLGSAYVGVYFKSEKSSSAYATSVSVTKDGVSVPSLTAPDANGCIYLWFSVAAANSGTWSSTPRNDTYEYVVTWTMSDGTTYTHYYQVNINITASTPAAE